MQVCTTNGKKENTFAVLPAKKMIVVISHPTSCIFITLLTLNATRFDRNTYYFVRCGWAVRQKDSPWGPMTMLERTSEIRV